MNHTLTCLEGTLNFDEEIKTQAIDIVTFRTGQQITINRDHLIEGQTLTENLILQLNKAEKIFNEFNLIKMEEINDNRNFINAVQVIYSFIPVKGAGQRVWQVTYACQISDTRMINFASLYPDEKSMENEMHRLAHCFEGFSLRKP
ncbi:DUF1795 domain-containing protein [Pantoea anthophila]|uniref:DcrB-related protein n=1 Tax=Pantoea anthophila TaxID=470931 RepID=UPI002DB9B9F0|nr:DcrB-related protein [Pantoea anthophila]MEB7540283.1 DUF1795 domain-containing protein [Pantoea anthophila]